MSWLPRRQRSRGCGPTLANTKLTADAFVSQLRHPRGIMPPFHERIVSDSEARAILAYLQSAPPPPPKLRTDVPKGVLDQKTCAACHRKLNPTVVAQFESSAMGKPGRQNPRVAFPTPEMTCAVCHGTNHDEIMATKGRVPEATCGYLESADAHKLSGDALVVEAREILAGLYKDKLIRPSHAQISAGLLPGPRYTAIDLPDGIAFHSPASLYFDVTPIEHEYFDMFSSRRSRVTKAPST